MIPMMMTKMIYTDDSDVGLDGFDLRLAIGPTTRQPIWGDIKRNRKIPKDSDRFRFNLDRNRKRLKEYEIKKKRESII